MEKKVYEKVKTVRYCCVFGCSRADRSFSTIDLARKYIRNRPECKKCVCEGFTCVPSATAILQKVITVKQYLKY